MIVSRYRDPRMTTTIAPVREYVCEKKNYGLHDEIGKSKDLKIFTLIPVYDIVTDYFLPFFYIVYLYNVLLYFKSNRVIE